MLSLQSVLGGLFGTLGNLPAIVLGLALVVVIGFDVARCLIEGEEGESYIENKEVECRANAQMTYVNLMSYQLLWTNGEFDAHLICMFRRHFDTGDVPLTAVH